MRRSRRERAGVEKHSALNSRGGVPASQFCAIERGRALASQTLHFLFPRTAPKTLLEKLEQRVCGRWTDTSIPLHPGLVKILKTRLIVLKDVGASAPRARGPYPRRAAEI